VTEAESGRRLGELLALLEGTLAELEQTDDSTEAVDKLASMAEVAREVQGEIERLRREESDAAA
jgi:hypothetical protein